MFEFELFPSLSVLSFRGVAQIFVRTPTLKNDDDVMSCTLQTAKLQALTTITSRGSSHHHEAWRHSVRTYTEPPQPTNRTAFPFVPSSLFEILTESLTSFSDSIFPTSTNYESDKTLSRLHTKVIKRYITFLSRLSERFITFPLSTKVIKRCHDSLQK